MNLLPLLTISLLLPAAAGGTASLLPPTDGEMLKCRTHDIPGYVMMVDGEIVYDYRGAGQDAENARKAMPADDDVMSLHVRCLRVRSTENASGWELRSAIIVVSMSGAPKVARAQLTELVEEQRLHHERTGRYASLVELGFTETRGDLSIDLKTNDDGWSASISFRNPAIRCRVAVGAAVAADPELRPGVPVCGSADVARS
jgi:hypothetical protein